jgi:hypothetical protein
VPYTTDDIYNYLTGTIKPMLDSILLGTVTDAAGTNIAIDIIAVKAVVDAISPSPGTSVLDEPAAQHNTPGTVGEFIINTRAQIGT